MMKGDRHVETSVVAIPKRRREGSGGGGRRGGGVSNDVQMTEAPKNLFSAGTGSQARPSS